MNRSIGVALGVCAGIVLGLAGGRLLNAAPRAPAYVISEIDVTNAEGYAKEYVPLATKALAASGQRRLVSGGKSISLSGPPPASRIVVSVFDSLEQAQAAYTSSSYVEARKIGDKYGKLRIYAVEGLGQNSRRR